MPWRQSKRTIRAGVGHFTFTYTVRTDCSSKGTTPSRRSFVSRRQFRNKRFGSSARQLEDNSKGMEQVPNNSSKRADEVGSRE